MTASEDYSSFVASQTDDASSITAVGTGRRDSGPVFPSPFRVWGRDLRTFDSVLVQPLKKWMRLEREVSLLYGMDYRELPDIGINRMDIDAIRAGTYWRGSSDDAERIVCCPEAGRPMTRAVGSNSSPPTSCTETTAQAQERIAQADRSARWSIGAMEEG